MKNLMRSTAPRLEGPKFSKKGISPPAEPRKSDHGSQALAPSVNRVDTWCYPLVVNYHGKLTTRGIMTTPPPMPTNPPNISASRPINRFII